MNLKMNFVDERDLDVISVNELKANGNKMYEITNADGERLQVSQIKTDDMDSLTPMDYRGIVNLFSMETGIPTKDIEKLEGDFSYGDEQHLDIYDVESNSIERHVSFEDSTEYSPYTINITEDKNTDKVEYNYDNTKYHVTEINDVVNGKTVNLFTGVGFISEQTGKKITTSMEITIRDSNGDPKGIAVIHDTGFCSINEKNYQLSKTDVNKILNEEINNQDDVYEVMKEVCEMDKEELTELSPEETLLLSLPVSLDDDDIEENDMDDDLE